MRFLCYCLLKNFQKNQYRKLYEGNNGIVAMGVYYNRAPSRTALEQSI